MNLVLGLYCNDLRQVLGYVKVTAVINRTNEIITEENVIKQIQQSWSDFNDDGGGKVDNFIEEHNKNYATQIEKFKVILV